MGIFDWLKRGGNSGKGKELPTAEDMVFESGKEEVAGLNFKTAIDAHMKWKQRLSAVIAGTSTEQLDPAVIGRDDQCALGKWIHGEGGQHYGSQDLFLELREHHAQFHRCAAEVLRTAQAGAVADAEKMLNAGAYQQASVDVVLRLARLYEMFALA